MYADEIKWTADADEKYQIILTDQRKNQIKKRIMRGWKSEREKESKYIYFTIVTLYFKLFHVCQYSTKLIQHTRNCENVQGFYIIKMPFTNSNRLGYLCNIVFYRSRKSVTCYDVIIRMKLKIYTFTRQFEKLKKLYISIARKYSIIRTKS